MEPEELLNLLKNAENELMKAKKAIAVFKIYQGNPEIDSYIKKCLSNVKETITWLEDYFNQSEN